MMNCRREFLANLRRARSAGLALALTLPAAAVAQQVTLSSPNGDLSIKGTLLSFEEGVYRIDTVMGELNVPAEAVECAGDACPPDRSEGIPGEAIELADKAGELRVRGKLVLYTGDTYQIDTTLGVLELPAGGVDCTGPGCPVLSAARPAPEAPEEQAEAEAEPAEDPAEETATAIEADIEAEIQAAVRPEPEAEPEAPTEPEAPIETAEPAEVLEQTPPPPDTTTETREAVVTADSKLIQIARLNGPADLRLAGPAAILEALTPTLSGRFAEAMGATATPIEVEYVSIAKARDEGLPGGSMGLRLTGGEAGPVTLLGQFTTGPDASLKLLEEGAADLVFATAPASLSDERLTGGLVLGSDGMVAVVAPGNPLTAIPTESLARVFSGEITDWSELGAEPGPIRVIGLPESHSTSESLSELLLAPAGFVARPADTVAPDIHTLTGIVAGDPHAIAFVPNSMRGQTRPLDVVTRCGLRTSPGADTFRTREYPFTQAIVARQGDTSATAISLLETLAANPQILREAGYVDAEIGLQSLETERAALATRLDEVPGGPLRTAATNALEGMERTQRLNQVLYFERGTNRLDLQSLVGMGRIMNWLEDNDIREAFIVGHAPTGEDPIRALNAARAAADLVLLEVTLSESAPDDLVFRRLAVGGLLPVVCPSDINHAATNSRVEIWVRGQS